ncbi:MAG: hypothetical protein E5X53_33785 [Mesorhizobium sp.]|nr:MAG: hypothetical protein EOR73_10510 [Mesorhizobium sp.]TIP69289.1 MAG: hypothetical protein E5X55_32950 [Mesorhizobium sp.]TIQ03002.1 MAG: hypothetical protein E5X57_31685 [Mesorhizobium sp.]TIR47485.1 MAG: hypothetical protein E5X53_33785 [Mesorhizobium sp.]TJV92484.1 MAG: hypothetical protein E5X52_33440 [Mesorhizobium sp.]
MTVQKKDYRTNRADYAIAAKHGRATAEGDRDELPAKKKKSLLVTDRRSAKLAANPTESAPDPKAKTRG